MNEKFSLIPEVHIFFLREDKVFLTRRYNTWYDDWLYSVPAGHVEDWETFKQAAIREIKEEVWVNIEEKDLNIVYFMQRKSNNHRVWVRFVVKEWSWELTNNEPNKCDDIARFDIKSIPSNISPYVKFILERADLNSDLRDKYFEFWY